MLGDDIDGATEFAVFACRWAEAATAATPVVVEAVKLADAPAAIVAPPSLRMLEVSDSTSPREKRRHVRDPEIRRRSFEHALLGAMHRSAANWLLVSRYHGGGCFLTSLIHWYCRAQNSTSPRFSLTSVTLVFVSIPSGMVKRGW